MSNLFEKKVISWKIEETEIILQCSFQTCKLGVYSD